MHLQRQKSLAAVQSQLAVQSLKRNDSLALAAASSSSSINRTLSTAPTQLLYPRQSQLYDEDQSQFFEGSDSSHSQSYDWDEQMDHKDATAAHTILQNIWSITEKVRITHVDYSCQ